MRHRAGAGAAAALPASAQAAERRQREEDDRRRRIDVDLPEHHALPVGVEVGHGVVVDRCVFMARQLFRGVSPFWQYVLRR